jgi:type IV secretory pathway VirB2 component (pilin)
VRGVPAGDSRERCRLLLGSLRRLAYRLRQARTRLGDYAVTEQMLQVCLGGGPGTGANSTPPNVVLSFRWARAGIPPLAIHPRNLIERENPNVKRYLRKCLSKPAFRTSLIVLGLVLLLAGPVLAQTTNSPWENAVNVLETAFTSTIARGLSLVAIVVSGLTFAFGEGGSKRVLAGVLFGVGMAIAAVNFLAWLFPGS